jgi:hypothetical protein
MSEMGKNNCNATVTSPGGNPTTLVAISPAP